MAETAESTARAPAATLGAWNSPLSAVLACVTVGGAALTFRWCGHRLSRVMAVNEQEAHRHDVLVLYRRILRAAQSWPSMKKQAVLSEIRQEFRRNAAEEDAHRVSKMVEDALSLIHI